MARPTTLNEALINKASEYLDVYQDLGQVVPSVIGLCSYLDVSKSIMYKWKADRASIELLDTLDRIEENQYLGLVNGGLSNALNSNITKLMLANHGLSDKVQVDNTSSDGSMSPSFDNGKYKAAQDKLNELD